MIYEFIEEGNNRFVTEYEGLSANITRLYEALLELQNRS
jgi:hypothetical protein